ncbi:hypothetical protein [Actinomadura sp. NPDC049753]|uniref:hypothetical protein n=1 Tax=Actinomadura sp. NPDC049753 TaxID=3154739 RepID=UPI00343D6B9F
MDTAYKNVPGDTAQQILDRARGLGREDIGGNAELHVTIAGPIRSRGLWECIGCQMDEVAAETQDTFLAPEVIVSTDAEAPLGALVVELINVIAGSEKEIIEEAGSVLCEFFGYYTDFAADFTVEIAEPVEPTNGIAECGLCGCKTFTSSDEMWRAPRVVVTIPASEAAMLLDSDRVHV